MPELEEIKEALDGLGKDFHEYKKVNDKALEEAKNGAISAEAKERLEKIDKSMDEHRDRVDGIETAMKRKPTGKFDDKTGREFTQEEIDSKVAHDSFLRVGYKSLTIEQQAIIKADRGEKSLSSNVDPDGGFFVSPQLEASILKNVDETTPMRSLAFVQTIGASSFRQRRRTQGHSGAAWTGETGPPPTSTGPKVGILEIFPNELSAEPEATQTLLDDGDVNIEQWINEEVSIDFSLTQNTAFVEGNGVKKPTGFLTYPAGTSDGQIEQVNTGSSGGVTGDGLIDIQDALKEPYQGNASWLMKRSTVGLIRKLKSSDNEYLWQPGLRAGELDILLGRPVVKGDDMPVAAADSLSIAYGDFRQGYKIVDRKGITILRDPYTNKPFVKFFTVMRVGGDVAIFEALKIGKLAA